MSTVYEYDDELASQGDNVALAIDTSGAYVGHFTAASALTASTGTTGVELEFESDAKEKANFTLYTRDKDGKPIFGQNKLQAIMSLFGIRGLKAVPGKVRAWDKEIEKWGEVDGEVFPDLLERKIGLVLQKELITKMTGRDGYKMQLFASFDPKSQLTSTEIRERKTEPKSIPKILKTLKDKDSRKAPEVASPSIGAIGGDY